MEYQVNLTGGIVGAVLSILLSSLFIHLASKPVIPKKKEGFVRAILTAIFGSALAGLVWYGLTDILPDFWPMIVAIAAWGLVASIVYRVKWLRGMLLGLVAGLLWFITYLVIIRFI